MSSGKKKNRLISRAKETTRQPKLPATSRRANKVGYRVIAISLYVPEAQFVDHVTDLLKQAGNPKANRSLVVREAILRLQKELANKTAGELLNDFNDHNAKRHESRLGLDKTY